MFGRIVVVGPVVERGDAAIQGVERAQNRAARGDYGGVAVLRHETDGGVPFWTLHGHLDPATLPARGDELKAGAKVIAFMNKESDGSFDVDRVGVGRDGLTPPM